MINIADFKHSLASDPLAIHPAYQPEITGIANRIRNKNPKAILDLFSASQKNYVIKNGVAEISIAGPLINMPSWVEFFGVGSYQRIRSDAWQAADDPDVRAIRLIVNSPGGSVDGAFETQQVLSQVSQVKPIIETVIESIGTSAAYLLASTAKTIIAGQSSTVGSIGAVLSMWGDKGFWAKLGISKIILVSSVSPYKYDDPEEEEGLNRLQAWVDALGQVFVERVAELRGVDPEIVLKNYGKGGLFVGNAAKAAGVVDEITGSGIKTMTEPQEQESVQESESVQEQTESESVQEQESVQESESVAPEGRTRLVNSKDAIAERKRIQAIQNLKAPGYEDLLYKASFVEPMTVAAVKAMIFDKMNDRRQNARANLETEANKQKQDLSGLSSIDPEETSRLANAKEIKQEAEKAKRFR